MKKPYSSTIIYSLLLFFIAANWHYPVMAQNGNSNPTTVSIRASAEIIGGDIRLETISDMGIIDARRLQEGDEIYINPVFDPEAGIMRASGMPNAMIRVSYISEMEVTRREGPGTLFFRYEVSGFAGDNQRESELLQATDREVRFNEDGQFFFWIGGRVDLSQAVPGSYDGEFTIEIEYI